MTNWKYDLLFHKIEYVTGAHIAGSVLYLIMGVEKVEEMHVFRRVQQHQNTQQKVHTQHMLPREIISNRAHVSVDPWKRGGIKYW